MSGARIPARMLKMTLVEGRGGVSFWPLCAVPVSLEHGLRGIGCGAAVFQLSCHRLSSSLGAACSSSRAAPSFGRSSRSRSRSHGSTASQPLLFREDDVIPGERALTLPSAVTQSFDLSGTADHRGDG
ncbi:hypothetical protein SKAU_G00006340 [Synaphobranchus kaupii]|uniref:Uncharacterized protein n=1 Tax=Synaphobranchus kaupii TaxID=118154 RepID=A0A9Q1JAS0_SYNKA|nr:hypothetical protein SKAU_G00006340 [Synaphobranchus kaupii]